MLCTENPANKPPIRPRVLVVGEALSDLESESGEGLKETNPDEDNYNESDF